MVLWDCYRKLVVVIVVDYNIAKVTALVWMCAIVYIYSVNVCGSSKERGT